MATCEPMCVGVRGSTEIRKNSSYEYEVYFEEDPCAQDKERVIFLSYSASNMIKNVDFFAPTSVVVKSGESYAKFEVVVRGDCEIPMARHIQIDARSSEVNAICGNVIANFTCEETPGIGEGENCMDLFFFEPYGHKTKRANNM